jgi:hypothetical protein
MSTWLWVVVGVAGFLFLSLVASLALAAVLGAISRRLEGEVGEDEVWAISSLSRERKEIGRQSRREQPASSEQIGAGKPRG